MNKTRGPDNPKSKLMWEFIRMVNEIQPKIFMIENVPGLLRFKDFFYELLESLEACGYVVRFTELNAVSYGVPQHRIRIFIDGGRKDTNFIPTFPVPQYYDPEAIKGGIFSRANVAEKCFAVNGFTKEEVKDVWWNTKLNILMNRKTAAEVVNQAVDLLVGESLVFTVKSQREKKGEKDEQTTKV
jgi:site-specific DNA-cytosine methylase